MIVTTATGKCLKRWIAREESKDAEVANAFFLTARSLVKRSAFFFGFPQGRLVNTQYLTSWASASQKCNLTMKRSPKKANVLLGEELVPTSIFTTALPSRTASASSAPVSVPMKTPASFLLPHQLLALNALLQIAAQCWSAGSMWEEFITRKRE